MCYWAAITGDLNLIEKALSSEVNVNFQNSSGHTPLHVAVMHNHEPIVEKLLENGADVNLKTNEGFTPICLAKLKGYTSITDLINAFELSLSLHFPENSSN
ncbi:Ankyrin repeats (3 copies) [Popillia japonica]|uniref:Ankyrin repeats (3 copies) n=1 Tax=Popillia japonica TaxID=7064 RepID=A0AAW1L0L4_POPJA